MQKPKRYSPLVHNDHDHHQHTHPQGWWANVAAALHLPGHTHNHEAPWRGDPILTNRRATRTLIWSLALLLGTTVLQFIIYAASGSVALLADTVHNLGDALNSLPLLVAFWLARRAPTKRYNYGLARAEDLAGFLIVVSIAFSAAFILWEVTQRFINPMPMENTGWVALAALIGFLGNEAVAWLELRTGAQIGSEAMLVDGQHARIDGLTSLAVLPAVAGSLLGLPILDPIFGVIIGIGIVFITWNATKSIWYRLMDAVDPNLFERVTAVIEQAGRIRTLRMRWVGHSLWLEGVMESNGELTIEQANELVKSIKENLERQIPNLGEITLSVEPQSS